MDKIPDMILVYDEGLFTEAELSVIKCSAADQGIVLQDFDKSPYVNSAFDWLTPVFELIASPEMASALFQGFMSDATKSAIKFILKKIWDKFHGLPLQRVSIHKKEPITNGIQFRVGKNTLILPVDVDEDKFFYAVDKFMEVSAQSSTDEQTFSFYEDNPPHIVSKTENELLQECLRENTEEQN